jgi:putative 4-mercaptohistidine N1-methyltranferase
MPSAYYESERGEGEYLLLHYGSGEGPGFPARCVSECVETSRLPSRARALDLGCAVGRSSFELARFCAEVVGIDYSQRFIGIAEELQKKGSFRFRSVEEGELTRPQRAVAPKGIDRKRVRFERGDAMNLRPGLGLFDVVLMANLIDRLSHPRKCLEQIGPLLRPGGQLIITSPYTWLKEYTPRRHWLGGFMRQGRPVKTFEALGRILSPQFRLLRRRDLPFLIREHARKYQFGLAEASIWLRRTA